MTITLQLSADQQRRFEESASRRDFAGARALLHQIVDAQVERILESRQSGARGRRALLSELAAELTDLPALADEAMTRVGIYGDHS